MTEKKYETVSEFVNNMVKKDNYNMSNLPYFLLACDKQFINKDKLRFEINKNIKFWNNYLKICHIDLKEHTCGQVLAFKKILKLLEE